VQPVSGWPAAARFAGQLLLPAAAPLGTVNGAGDGSSRGQGLAAAGRG
jgi:hypothetical protein